MVPMKGSIFFNYSENQMSEALKAIENGMSTVAAARMFGVLRLTLMYKSKEKNGTNQHTLDQPHTLMEKKNNFFGYVDYKIS